MDNSVSLRKEVLLSIKNLLKNRLFTININSTPSGWIKVGENGPEWLFKKENKL